MLIRPAQSLEYVRVSVSATDSGVAIDPTHDTVALAFVSEGTPVNGSTTFIIGSWETDASVPTAPVYYARVLAGPTGDYVPTAASRMDVYVKVTDSPEIPIQRAGTVRFT